MIPNAAWRKREERKRTKDNLEERAIFEITWFVDATKLERTRRMCFVLCVLRERERVNGAGYIMCLNIYI